MDKPKFLQGIYTVTYVHKKQWGRKRNVLGVFKGNMIMGILAHHPKAKQIVFHADVCSTSALLEFVLPLMDRANFNLICKIAKLKQENNNGST